MPPSHELRAEQLGELRFNADPNKTSKMEMALAVNIENNRNYKF
jgi:hypothetical protein